MVGLAGGFVVGGGLVALLVVLDIVPRLMRLCGLGGRYASVWMFESAIVAGALVFTAADFEGWSTRLPPPATALVGFGFGMFVGMLAAALTEVLNVFPITAKRLRMEASVGHLLTAVVLGKVAGALFDWLVFHS